MEDPNKRAADCNISKVQFRIQESYRYQFNNILISSYADPKKYASKQILNKLKIWRIFGVLNFKRQCMKAKEILNGIQLASCFMKNASSIKKQKTYQILDVNKLLNK